MRSRASYRGRSSSTATEGFVYFGVRYPSFTFSFHRAGRGFAASELNEMTRQQVDSRWRTVFEIAPAAFRNIRAVDGKTAPATDKGNS